MIGTIDKVRSIVHDDLKTDGREIFTYVSSSSSKIFTFIESNVSTILLVLKNGATYSSSNYSYSSATQKLTVTGTLTAGDVLEIDYSYYPKYSDNEIIGYIRGAIAYLSVGQYTTFSLESGDLLTPSPTEAEENLLALIAITLMKGNVSSYRTPELSITFEKGDSVDVKIKTLIRQFTKAFGVLDYIDLEWDYDETYTPSS